MKLSGFCHVGGQGRQSHLSFVASNSLSLFLKPEGFIQQLHSTNPNHSVAFLIPSDLCVKKESVTVVQVEGKLRFDNQLYLFRCDCSHLSFPRYAVAWRTWLGTTGDTITQ